MLLEAVQRLYQYNRWATERILDQAGGLTPQELHAPGVTGHGSIRDTLLHLINTQQSWLSWWDGSLSAQEAYGLSLNPADYPDLAAVRAVWETLEGRTQAFVFRLREEDLGRVYAHTMPNGANWSMALWQMMLHVANHGTQHRSEVAAMLTGFGRSPGNLDLLFYLAPGG